MSNGMYLIIFWCTIHQILPKFLLYCNGFNRTKQHSQNEGAFKSVRYIVTSLWLATFSSTQDREGTMHTQTLLAGNLMLDRKQRLKESITAPITNLQLLNSS